jgi:hypothetical protein
MSLLTGQIMLGGRNLADTADPGSSRANVRVPHLSPAAAVATANVASLSGLQVIDGYTLTATDLVLLTGQTSQRENGLYQAASGAWSRPTEFPTGGLVKGRTCAIINGSKAGHQYLLQTNITVTIDTGSQTWIDQTSSGSSGVTTVQVNGSGFTNRATVDFIGGTNTTVTGVDNSGSGRTEVTIASTGSWVRTQTDPLYAPQWPNLVAPTGATFPTSFSSGGTLATFTPRGVRVIVPKAGTLHDVSWFVTIQSGNMAAAIYDTGDASAGNRTLLASSGSLATGAAGWQTWDPSIAVTAGQQLDFVLMADNVTAAFARLLAGLQNICQLPNTNFNPVAGGASPKLIFALPAVASLTAWATTVAEASVALTSTASPVLIARVS